jgi:hypothetical protein
MTDDRTIGQGPDPQPDTTPAPAGQPDAAIPPDAPTAARAARPSEALSASADQASLEPAGPTGATPARVVVSSPQRPSRARWGVAGLIAFFVVALSAAGLFVLVGASSKSVVAAWTPADAAVYVEVRGDLPGDQRQNLGRFLAHFPGFADQATLDTKLDESLDKLVGKASDGKHDWTREIKPWFGGQVALSLSSFPTPTMDGSQADTTRALLVVTQKDPAAAIAWTKSLEAGPTTEETYRGVTLTVFKQEFGPKIVAAANAGVLLVGDDVSVKAALDRNGKDGLAASKAFASAMAGIDAEQVTRSYVDLKAYFEAITRMTESLGGGMAPGLNKAMLDKLPPWVGVGGRFESDAFVSDIASPVVASAPTIDQHESTIAGHLPASTVALIEVHQFDKLFAYQLGQMRADPMMAMALDQVESAASSVGGLDHLVGWIGDVAVVVTSDGKTPAGGLVIVPNDVAAADKVVVELRNLVALAGSSSGITTRDEAYGAGTITTIDFGDLSRLTGGGGFGLPLSGHAEVSYTVQDGLVIVGAGPAWVKSIVDVKAGGSLADQGRFKDAIKRVEARSTSILFVDLAAVRTLAEPLLSEQPGSNYATEVKPYVQPFDVLAGAGWTDGDTTRARYVVTVINP